MAREIPGFTIPLEASADLSASQFCAVISDANGRAAVAGAGVHIIGVLQNKPASLGAESSVMVDGVTIGFSGDAGWSDALTEIASGVDLFICAVWSFDVPDPTFVDLQTLLHHLDRLACKRLILTHLGPSMLARLPEVPIEVATDGLLIPL